MIFMAYVCHHTYTFNVAHQAESAGQAGNEHITVWKSRQEREGANHTSTDAFESTLDPIHLDCYLQYALTSRYILRKIPNHL